MPPRCWRMHSANTVLRVAAAAVTILVWTLSGAQVSYAASLTASAMTRSPSASVNETRTTVVLTPTLALTPSDLNVSITASSTVTCTQSASALTVTRSPRSNVHPTYSMSITSTLTDPTEEFSKSQTVSLPRTITLQSFSDEHTETTSLTESVSSDPRSSSTISTWNATFTASRSPTRPTRTLSVRSSTLTPSNSTSMSLSNSSSASTSWTPSLASTPTYIRTLTLLTHTPNTTTSSASSSISRTPTNTTSGPTRPLTTTLSSSSSSSKSLSLSASVSHTTTTSSSTTLSASNSSSISVSSSPSPTPTPNTLSYELTVSKLPPYAIPTMAYNTSDVVESVFLASIQSFYSDPASFDSVSFGRDLFAELVATAAVMDGTRNGSSTTSSPIPSPLFFLTDSAALSGSVLILSACQVDYRVFDSITSNFYNMSVCRSDDVGSACTVITPSKKCKVTGVNFCSCSPRWSSYPPTKFVNASAIPGYPEPPTPTTSAPPPGDANTTAAASRAFTSLENNVVVQIQFAFLLQNAPAFRPRTIEEVVRTYALLRNVTSAVLGRFGALHRRYFLIPSTGNTTNNTMFPSPPPPVVVRLTSSASFLPVAAALIFPLLMVGVGAHKLYKYVRWRLSVGRFRVAAGRVIDDDDGNASMQDEHNVDDMEMVGKLGNGAWVRDKNPAATSFSTATLGRTSVGFHKGGEAAMFDPLGERARQDMHRAVSPGGVGTGDGSHRRTKGTRRGERDNDDDDERMSSSSSSGKNGVASTNGSAAVVRELHVHGSSTPPTPPHEEKIVKRLDRQRVSQAVLACARLLSTNRDSQQGSRPQSTEVAAIQALLGSDIKQVNDQQSQRVISSEPAFAVPLPATIVRGGTTIESQPRMESGDTDREQEEGEDSFMEEEDDQDEEYTEESSENGSHDDLR